MTVVVIGIDLGKNSCSVAGHGRGRQGCVSQADGTGPAWWRSCAGIQCASSQWRPAAGRIIWAGSSPKTVTRCWLMSPEYVRPYVKAQKNDDRDAEAIAEAAIRRRASSLR